MHHLRQVELLLLLIHQMVLVLWAVTMIQALLQVFLPNVWGMTLKAPTANGLDMSARLGLYTHMNGGENALGNGEINIRETSGSIAGSFGSVLVGRSLVFIKVMPF